MAQPPLTRAQARAYVARWRAVRAAEIRELRAASPESKLRQTASLMLSARALGWRVPESSLARERWRALRQALGVGD
jgi:hypothetical protein